MVKLKKFFYSILLIISIVFASVFITSCNKNEIEKVSSGLTNYNINMSLDENMQISASEKINYKNDTGNSLDCLCFHLYPRAFRKDAIFKPYTSLTLATCFPNGISYGDIEILKVFVTEKENNFELIGEDEDILKIPFDFSLENKKIIEIQIDFKLTLPNCTHRFGFYEGSVNLGNWYPVVCPYVNGDFYKSPYYATGDPFCSDVSNYNITFNYPQKYYLSSTGNIETTLINDVCSSKISALAVRDFAMNLTEDVSKMETMVNETKVCYVGYKNDLKVEEYLKLSSKALEYFNKNFGAYPYKTLTIVKTPFIYGGMEYPNLVFISDSIDDEDEIIKVIVHEISHQWWYGVVGNNEITEAWLDESLAEYSTALFFKNNTEFGISYDDLIKNAISSYTLYVDVIKTIRGDVNTKMNLAVNEYQNDYEYSYMVYVKGVIMFDELKNAVGEQKLISGLKKYYFNNKYKIATKKDFYIAFSSACHKDLENFFENYLNGTTIITNVS